MKLCLEHVDLKVYSFLLISMNGYTLDNYLRRKWKERHTPVPKIHLHKNNSKILTLGDGNKLHGFSDIWEFLKHAGGRCFLLLAHGSREYY